MYQNIRTFQLVALIATLCMTFGYGLFASNTGADCARTTLARGQAISAQYPGPSGAEKRDSAFQTLRNETSAKLAHLTVTDRIDYAEYMSNELAKMGTAQESDDLSELAMIFITAGPSEQEIRAGQARLLASNNPKIRAAGENLDLAGNVKLHNGEMGQDMSVFDLALHDPKVPRDRLIKAMFKLAPVESAQWFIDHNGLSASEKAGLESDLQKAWKMHRALNDVNADKETKAALDDSVKNPQLDHWLHSPSWILRSLGNGLLEKHPHWQTPDLKKGMQPVQIPENLQLPLTNSP